MVAPVESTTNKMPVMFESDLIPFCKSASGRRTSCFYHIHCALPSPRFDGKLTEPFGKRLKERSNHTLLDQLGCLR